MSGRFSRLVYVENLPADIRKSEVEDLFHKYGRILDIELKIPPRPPCYCFVEFENARDAEDAIRGRDGYYFDGCLLRIELAHGGREPSSSNERRSGHSRVADGGHYGSGGGSAAVAISAPAGGTAAGSTAAAAPVAEEKKEEPKEESDDDMGFSLFD